MKVISVIPWSQRLHIKKTKNKKQSLESLVWGFSFTEWSLLLGCHVCCLLYVIASGSTFFLVSFWGSVCWHFQLCHLINTSSSFTSPLFFPGGSVVKNSPAKQEIHFWSRGPEDPLEKEMATHTSILAWKTPWTEKLGRLLSMRSQKSWIWLIDSTRTAFFFSHFLLLVFKPFSFLWALVNKIISCNNLSY